MCVYMYGHSCVMFNCQVSDLDGYTSPGPGTYNAHTTCFGSPGAPSCRPAHQF